MTIREPECIALKRRGAKYVSKLLAGKSEQEKLQFWQQRTAALIAKQTTSRSKSEKSTA